MAKNLNNQLIALEVVDYDSNTKNSEYIEEADPEEETSENPGDSSSDLSSIVAELGINTDNQSTSEGGSTLIKELASIGSVSPQNSTVKTLLPNALFSSENDATSESCSVLISSGLSIPLSCGDDKEMNIPLGQLEVVNVQHQKSTSKEADVANPDKNVSTSNAKVNTYHRDKKSMISSVEENTQPTVSMLSSATHKLPPVLARSSTPKSASPTKPSILRKKSVGQPTNKSSNQNKKPQENSENSSLTAVKNVENNGGIVSPEKSGNQKNNIDTLNTNKVNSSSTKEKSSDATVTPILVSGLCSLTSVTEASKETTLPTTTTILEPPIIRTEDFPVTEDHAIKGVEKETNKAEEIRPSSPDIIILEGEKSKSIVTVTLDSEDENEDNAKKVINEEKRSQEVPKPVVEGKTIRKEMELLRNQIHSETDDLLLDEPEIDKPVSSLALNITLSKNPEPSETLLSPIEEAICSLNKKLQTESEESKIEVEKDKMNVSPAKSKKGDGVFIERPRTRFGAREKKKEDTDSSDVEETNKKDDAGKNKQFKDGLVGKELFICGNEKCTFAAEDDSTLKDHLYVCDLSRESSVLICPHCSRQSKQFHPYLEHLKYHGEKKYHCGLCSFSTAVDSSVLKHLKVKHKSPLVKTLPKESEKGHLVYYPKNHKTEKVDFEVNGYSPGDEDKLPLQSVYQVNVKCAKCPYFTKVRSNMVRHLKIHVKSVETEGSVVVPSTAPTNPVPCLETKERMFDKMTNLAASSQLAQTKVESPSPEDEAKLPQFIAEHMRYKCCLPDCNYITVDDGMLKHHIKALHTEINYYSCPHCPSTVHIDVRHVTLDKIGHHLKHHDNKLYKCAYCIYFHFQKNIIVKHTMEKHSERRFFVQTIREPKSETPTEETPSSSDSTAKLWKCGLCSEYSTISKASLMEHLSKVHNTKSRYLCQICSLKAKKYKTLVGHFAVKHPGEKVSIITSYHISNNGSSVSEAQSGNSSGADSSNEHFDTTPIWQRGASRVRHIRGILIEEEEVKTKKGKRASVEECGAETSETVEGNEDAFYCPLCTNKKKPFYTRNESFFRTHLYQELNYQQFACMLCGKMFVDRKDFDKHHSRMHADKPQALKQTKEDHEIKFWVDQVIAKRKKQMEDKKRKLNDSEKSGSEIPSKKKKEV